MSVELSHVSSTACIVVLKVSPTDIVLYWSRTFTFHFLFIYFNDSPSKMMKNTFYLILKDLFVIKIFSLSRYLIFVLTLWSCRENRLKDKGNFKIYDVTTLTSNYDTHTYCPICSKNSGSSSILFLNYRHRTHFAMSAGVSFYFIWILYGYRWRSLSGFSAMKHMNWKTHPLHSDWQEFLHSASFQI